MFECYAGRVVHIFGGIHEFVGEIDIGDHSNGPGWIRIINPCVALSIKEGKRLYETVSLMGGPGHNYEHYVDVYIPPGESMIEIRVVDPESQMMRAYKKEIGRPKVRNIILPGEDVEIPKPFTQ